MDGNGLNGHAVNGESTATALFAGERIAPRTGLLRFITCGSVDDGKSTLIGRLLYDSKGLLADQVTALEAASRRRGMSEVDLSLLTDGLTAEREQGITIDVAYRYFSTPARKFIIGDSPGHAQYTRNMVTAASTADVAVLLVDAQNGIQPQTRRHAYLARWVGINRVVLAVNKMDLVGWSEQRFREICAEFDTFADGLGFSAAQEIPLSALKGDMVVERGTAMPWYRGPTLIAHLESIPARHDEDAGSPFRFPVQRVTRVTARNAQAGWNGDELRGYQGTIASGRIGVGDQIVALPSGLPARIERILTPDGDLSEARADRAVTLCLDREIDISRGDVFAPAGARPRIDSEFEAEVCWFDADALNPAQTYLLKLGEQLLKARVRKIGARIDIDTLKPGDPPPTLAMNDIAHVTMKVQRAIPLDAYRDNRVTGAFILIDEVSNRTVAAGTIA
jgi:sulfate adenylyltransferase large subunit